MDQAEVVSLVAVAKRSPKTVNQDACQAIESSAAGIRAVILADGIGSDEGSEHTSTEIVDHFARQINQEVPPSAPGCGDMQSMYGMFRLTRERLTQRRELERAEKGDSAAAQFSGGSTALIIVEHLDRIVIAYLGNGAVVQLRADFNDFPDHAVLPWSVTDLLNPHSRYVRGKNVLFRFLSADATVEQSTPAVLTLSKDTDGPGDILIACTDGITSRDQSVVGKNEMGIWTRTEAALPLLYQHLNEFFKHGLWTHNALEANLNSYLEELETRGEMEDDCALGVLITPQALAYQVARRENFHREEEKHENDPAHVDA